MVPMYSSSLLMLGLGIMVVQYSVTRTSKRNHRLVREITDLIYVLKSCFVLW